MSEYSNVYGVVLGITLTVMRRAISSAPVSIPMIAVYGRGGLYCVRSHDQFCKPSNMDRNQGGLPLR